MADEQRNNTRTVAQPTRYSVSKSGTGYAFRIGYVVTRCPTLTSAAEKLAELSSDSTYLLEQENAVTNEIFASWHYDYVLATKYHQAQ